MTAKRLSRPDSLVGAFFVPSRIERRAQAGPTIEHPCEQTQKRLSTGHRIIP